MVSLLQPFDDTTAARRDAAKSALENAQKARAELA